MEIERRNSARHRAGPSIARTLAKLLPTPTATQPGGTPEQFLERKRRGPMNRTDPTVTDLGLLIQHENMARGWGRYTAAIERWEHLTGRPAPEPLNEKGKLSAALVEWMMGYPSGWATDYLATRAALRALGNSVVPPQAAEALRRLCSTSNVQTEKAEE